MLKMKITAPQKCSYQTMIRDKVDGPIRIGAEFEIEEDIFSLAFASCFKKDLVAYLFSREEGSEEPDYAGERVKLM